MALGVAWVVDGLEITIASNVTTKISPALHLLNSGVAFAVGTVYLLGEVAGALSSAACPTSGDAETCS